MSSRTSAASVALLADRKALQELYDAQAASAEKVEGSECILTRLRPTKEGGYSQVALRGTSTKIMIHHIPILLKEARLPGHDEDVSHLCHNRRCFNKDHVIIESKVNNQRRKNCKVTVICWHCDKVATVCESTRHPVTAPRSTRSSARRQAPSAVVCEDRRINILDCLKIALL